MSIEHTNTLLNGAKTEFEQAGQAISGADNDLAGIATWAENTENARKELIDKTHVLKWNITTVEAAGAEALRHLLNGASVFETSTQDSGNAKITTAEWMAAECIKILDGTGPDTTKEGLTQLTEGLAEAHTALALLAGALTKISTGAKTIDARHSVIQRSLPVINEKITTYQEDITGSASA